MGRSFLKTWNSNLSTKAAGFSLLNTLTADSPVGSLLCPLLLNAFSLNLNGPDVSAALITSSRPSKVVSSQLFILELISVPFHRTEVSRFT
jgi:hypothetical protein